MKDKKMKITKTRKMKIWKIRKMKIPKTIKIKKYGRQENSTIKQHIYGKSSRKSVGTVLLEYYSQINGKNSQG